VPRVAGGGWDLGLGVTVAAQLVLVLLHTRLWDDLWTRLDHNRRRLRRTYGCWYDGRESDGALLEFIGELLVEEIANHENCDDRHDVENIEG